MLSFDMTKDKADLFSKPPNYLLVPSLILGWYLFSANSCTLDPVVHRFTQRDQGHWYYFMQPISTLERSQRFNVICQA